MADFLRNFRRQIFRWQTVAVGCALFALFTFGAWESGELARDPAFILYVLLVAMAPIVAIGFVSACFKTDRSDAERTESFAREVIRRYLSWLGLGCTSIFLIGGYLVPLLSGQATINDRTFSGLLIAAATGLVLVGLIIFSERRERRSD